MSDLAVRDHQALNPVTGELLDLAATSSADLAQTIADIKAAHSALGEFEAQISGELLRRLDAEAHWTLHEGEFTITAPSPSAGTVDYPSDALEDALAELILEGVIAASAAEKACDRKLVLELRVPFDADHRELARKVKEALTITVADVEVRVLRSEARSKASASGIAALRKVPGTVEALDGASVTKDVPARRVTVKPRGA